MSAIRRARDEICRIGASLHARGYVHASAGNISIRLDDGSTLITPTDASLGALEPDALAHVDAQGQRLGGDAPSKTLALHTRIYAADAEARCVIHTHSTNLVALTLEGVWRESDVVPPITPYFVMKVGHVPLIPYRRPGDPQVAELVAAAIGARPIRALMLDRLGPVVWHTRPDAASAVLEELEETARLWRSCEPKPAPLTEPQIDELRRAFGARW